jgi:hypothetical protein
LSVQAVPRRKFGLAVVFVASALVALAMIALVEFGLRVALSPADYLRPTLKDDPYLGLVIAPGTQGHDANGFRNPSVPSKADVVAIGDSFTYGYNATRPQSWPAQLAQTNGLAIYNAGLGGFGPLQHLRVVDTVVPKLKPRSVIVAMYIGNDLMDAYNLTQKSSQWASFRTSVRVEGQLTEVDRQGVKQWELENATRRFGALRDALAQHSMIYAVLRATVLGPLSIWWAARTSDQPWSLDDHMPWSDPTAPGVATVFSARTRLLAIDESLPEIREAMEITGRALAATKASADRQGVHLHVALIPTKEHVYCEALKSRQVKLPSTHEKLCTVEPIVMRKLSHVLQSLGIPHKDTTPELSAAVMRGERVFLANKDGHPNAAGYKHLAQTIDKAWPKAELLR